SRPRRSFQWPSTSWRERAIRRSVRADTAPGRRRLEALAACLAYLALTILLTWPLARGLAHDIPSDFGDPLLNCWILAWDADHMLRALRGDVAGLGEYW